VLANCYATVDRSKEADVLKEGVAVAPSSYDMQARLVALLIENRKFGEASPYLAQMSQLRPSPGECKKVQKYVSAARSAMSEAGEYSEALRAALRPCER